MKEINYTVIIPHYNIPQLLMRCLESIPLREDIQVIVVDDCSPGADKYIEQYPALSRPYLEFYQTPIGGSAGRARNVGIEHAKGRWLTFVDSDDFFVEDIEQLLDKYKNREEDVMYCKSTSVMSDDITKSSGRHCFHYHFDNYAKTGDDRPLRYEFDALWGKFIKKTLIDKHHIRFDEVRYSNDTYFSAAIGVFAKSVFVPDELVYIVTERAGSLTSAPVMSLEEWRIRFQSAMRVQALFDENNVKFKKYGFALFMLRYWSINKKEIVKEFFRLSWKNKCRFFYVLIREFKTSK